MTIIVFLLDNTPSMSQKCSQGPTFLDLSKNAVETFLKFRSRDPARSLDRYMLLTFDETPQNIKAGWRENQAAFMQELRTLKCTGHLKFGQALGNALHLLNVNRLTSGIDNFGHGRYPSFIEPAVILVISDGGHLSIDNPHLNSELEISRSISPGSECYIEPFRWDQRIFSAILRIPGQIQKRKEINLPVPHDIAPIESLCESTGGRSYCISAPKMLTQSMEHLVMRVQTGVMVLLEKFGPDPNAEDLKPKLNNGLINNCVGENKQLMKVVVENGFIQQNHCRPGDVQCFATIQNYATSKSALQIKKELSETLIDEKPQSIDNGAVKIDDLAEPDLLIIDSNDGVKKSVNNEVQNGTVVDQQCIDSLASGSTASWQSVRSILYVRRDDGRGHIQSHWPIPEAYFPDETITSLPPRNAQALLKFKCDPCEPLLMTELPYDKYELGPSALTQYILSRKQPSICWQVFSPNSTRPDDLGQPIGYLKASTGLNSVSLIVLPYNYPVFMSLLNDLKQNHTRNKATGIGRAKLDSYCKSIPPYYAEPIKKVLVKNNINIMSDMPQQNKFLNYNLLAYLKNTKRDAKEEHDRICNAVTANKAVQSQLNGTLNEFAGLRLISTIINPGKNAIQSLNNTRPDLATALAELEPVESKDPLLKISDFTNFHMHLALKSKSVQSRTIDIDQKMADERKNRLRNALYKLDDKIRHSKPSAQLFKNPFDIPRSQLLQQIQKMRVNLKQHLDSKGLPVLEGGCPGTRLRFQDAEELHRLPVGQMGNYQDYLKMMPAPFKPMDSQKVQVHTFGNPFKVDKRMLVDEADIDISMGGSSGASLSGSATGSSKGNENLGTRRRSLTGTGVAGSSSNQNNEMRNRDPPLPKPGTAGRPPKRKWAPMPKDFDYRKIKRLDDTCSLPNMSPGRMSLDQEAESEPDFDRASTASEPCNMDVDFELNLNLDDFRAQPIDSIRKSPEHLDEYSTEENSPDSSKVDIKRTSTDEEVLVKQETRRPSDSKAPPEVDKAPVVQTKPEELPQIKAELAVLIRRPRINNDAIFAILAKLTGEVRQHICKWAYVEAMRFKRNELARKIESMTSS